MPTAFGRRTENPHTGKVATNTEGPRWSLIRQHPVRSHAKFGSNECPANEAPCRSPFLEWCPETPFRLPELNRGWSYRVSVTDPVFTSPH
jgi:hypothetical protein